jgi:hypothetical protein
MSALLPRHGHAHLASTSRQRGALRLRRGPALLCAILTGLLLWHSVLSPRRYPPQPAGSRLLQLPAGLPPPPPFGHVELVVSRFRDDLAWLPPLAAVLNASVTVYCKARSSRAQPVLR